MPSVIVDWCIINWVVHLVHRRSFSIMNRFLWKQINQMHLFKWRFTGITLFVGKTSQWNSMSCIPYVIRHGTEMLAIIRRDDTMPCDRNAFHENKTHVSLIYSFIVLFIHCIYSSYNSVHMYNTHITAIDWYSEIPKLKALPFTNVFQSVFRQAWATPWWDLSKYFPEPTNCSMSHPCGVTFWETRHY